jgi:gluconolactonase
MQATSSLVLFLTLGIIAHAEDKPQTFQDSPVVTDGASLTLVTEGFKFTEGPARDAQGDVYFTDQPNDRIHRWEASSGKVSLFLEPCGRSNGLYFASDGSLLACADEKNELWRIDPKTKTHEVLLGKYDGKLFNGPNDVWTLPNGDLYFTDPFYKRPYWNRGDREQDGQHVYFLKKGSKEATRVVSDLKQPNGIVGNAKGDRLYVADIGDGKTYHFDIAKGGTLTNKTKLADLGSDGMTLDEAGNLYLTGKGVTVFDPAGKKIEHMCVSQAKTGRHSLSPPWTRFIQFP